MSHSSQRPRVAAAINSSTSRLYRSLGTDQQVHCTLRLRSAVRRRSPKGTKGAACVRYADTSRQCVGCGTAHCRLGPPQKDPCDRILVLTVQLQGCDLHNQTRGSNVRKGIFFSAFLSVWGDKISKTCASHVCNSQGSFVLQSKLFVALAFSCVTDCLR